MYALFKAPVHVTSIFYWLLHYCIFLQLMFLHLNHHHNHHHHHIMAFDAMKIMLTLKVTCCAAWRSRIIGLDYTSVAQQGRDTDPSPSSSAEVKNRVELYLYSPLGPLWHMKGWNLPTHLLPCIICPSRHTHSAIWNSQTQFWAAIVFNWTNIWTCFNIQQRLKRCTNAYILMSVNLRTEGDLDNTLRSPVNHVSFDQNHIIHEQED